MINKPLIFPLDQEVDYKESELISPAIQDQPVPQINPEQYLYTGGKAEESQDLYRQAVNLANAADSQTQIDPEIRKQQEDVLNRYKQLLEPKNEEVEKMRQFDAASRLLGSLGDSANQYLQSQLNKNLNTPTQYTSSGLEEKAMKLAQAPIIQKQQQDEADRLLKMYNSLIDKEAKSASKSSNLEKARILLGAAQGIGIEGRSLRGTTRLDNKQVDSIFGIDDTVGKLDELQELKPAFDTGPIAGRVAAFRQAVGMDEADRTAFKNKTQRLLATYIKNISGTAASDKEREFLQNILPNANMSDEAFLKAVQDFKKELQNSKNRLINIYEKQGKVVEQYKSQPETKQLSPKDQQALDWAKSNPNDPRSAAILKKLGM